MRRAIVAVLALVVVSLPAVASHAPATQGPFVGTVEEDETDLHHYDNNPTGKPCIATVRSYLVQITYAPADDELLMEVSGREVVAENGTNQTVIERGVCTAFEVAVTGVDVADVAAYEVHVVPLVPH